MSNCIRISKNVVNFTTAEMDVPKFRSFIESVPASLEAAQGDTLTAWWWLVGNCTFTPRGVTIAFGEGCNSSHTGRDWRHTCNLVSKFMRKEKTHTFHIRDESDGFRKVYREPTTFGKEIPDPMIAYMAAKAAKPAASCTTCKGTGKMNLRVVEEGKQSVCEIGCLDCSGK